LVAVPVVLVVAVVAAIVKQNTHANSSAGQQTATTLVTPQLPPATVSTAGACAAPRPDLPEEDVTVAGAINVHVDHDCGVRFRQGPYCQQTFSTPFPDGKRLTTINEAIGFEVDGHHYDISVVVNDFGSGTLPLTFPVGGPSNTPSGAPNQVNVIETPFAGIEWFPKSGTVTITDTGGSLDALLQSPQAADIHLTGTFTAERPCRVGK
jgi:hypothetical protein